MKRKDKPSVASVLQILLEVAWWLWIAVGILIAADTVIEAAKGTGNVRLDLLVSFDLDHSSYQVVSTDSSVEDALIADAEGKMIFGTTSPLLIVTWVGWLALWMGGWLVVLHQLRATIRTIAAGDPFAARNASRIRMIGIVIVIMEAGQWLLLLGQQLYLNNHFLTTGLTFRTLVRPNLELVFLGLAVLVIAEVFRTGKNLRDDQAFTV